MKTNNKAILTDREEQIMRIFWNKGPLFIREILEYFELPKPHFNTISTIVRGLEEKGFVTHTSYGNTYRYESKVSENEFAKINLKGIIGKFFENSALNAVSTLVKEEEISLSQLRELINMLEKEEK